MAVPAAADPLLAVDGLSVALPAPGGPREVIRGVSFALRRGEALGLVGESGSGKTLTVLALLGLLPAGARVSGRAVLAGAGDLLALPPAALRRVRGRRLAMVFQEPAGALNPVLSIGFQLREAVRLHHGLRGAAAKKEALRLLERVAMADAARRLDAYPHELSGGQRQRAMLALALAGGPDLLLADEPTTALDVSVQARILALLDELRRDLGLAIILVTHDLAVVAETCERLLVMRRGEIAFDAEATRFFAGEAVAR